MSLHKFTLVLLLSAAIIIPGYIAAQESQRGNQKEQHAAQNKGPYYDSAHRDWHQWNDNEEQTYKKYQSEHHKQDRSFAESSEKEQQDYWKWRHKHPDAH